MMAVKLTMGEASRVLSNPEVPVIETLGVVKGKKLLNCLCRDCPIGYFYGWDYHEVAGCIKL